MSESGPSSEPPSAHGLTLDFTGALPSSFTTDRLLRVCKALERHFDRAGAVTVLFCDDAAVRELNSKFRGLDEATDVLTWQGPDFPGAPLGDIAVNRNAVSRACASGCRTAGWDEEHETAFLVAHGLLHLAGYDDQTAEEAAQMVELANQAMVATGFMPDRNWASLPHEEDACQGAT